MIKEGDLDFSNPENQKILDEKLNNMNPEKKMLFMDEKHEETEKLEEETEREKLRPRIAKLREGALRSYNRFLTASIASRESYSATHAYLMKYADDKEDPKKYKEDVKKFLRFVFPRLFELIRPQGPAAYEISYEPILKEYLKDSSIVDLGAGNRAFPPFLMMANVAGAKDYTAIDFPMSEKIEEIEIEKVNNVQKKLEELGVPLKICKNRFICGDMLTVLNEKIPNNSSNFAVYTIAEQEMGKEYEDLTEELIAKKTKIGGIIIVNNSEICNDMDRKFKNFEKIYKDDQTVIYLRKE